MILLLIQLEGLVEIVKNAVDAAAHVSSLRQSLELLLEFALSPAHDGRKDHHALALRQCFQVPNNLIGSLFRNRLAA